MIIKKTLSKLKGLKYRFDLLEECDRLKKTGKSLPKNYKKLIFKSPTKYDDFINILCFIDNREETNLIDVGANEGVFSKDFLNFFPKTKHQNRGIYVVKRHCIRALIFPCGKPLFQI